MVAVPILRNDISSGAGVVYGEVGYACAYGRAMKSYEVNKCFFAAYGALIRTRTRAAEVILLQAE